MVDINNIKGLQELFKEKLFEVASIDKVIEDIYPIVRLANIDTMTDDIIWNICVDIVTTINNFKLYKFYADKFHYNIKYDFEDDTLYITNTHKDSENLITNTLKNKEFTFNGKDCVINSDCFDIVFEI